MDNISTVEDIESWLRWQTWPDTKDLIRRYGSTPYKHPYGFSIVRLQVPYLSGWQARVHFWKNVSQQTYELEVHCHGAWRLRSLVVIGAVNETQYQFSQHPKGSYREYMVVKSQDNSCSTLKYTGKRASLESSELVVRGTESGILAIAGDQFHSTVPVDGNLAVTLAITEETDRSDSSRIMSQQIADELIFRNESTSIELDIAAADAAYESILMHQDGWASFVFVRRGRRVLMARTKRNPDYWMPIGGRAKTGDASPLDTAHRELEEEIGVSVERSHFYYLGWQPRDIGVGATHFWSLQLPTQHPYTLNESEFREASWLSLEECQAIDLFPGTIAMLPQLQRHMAGA